MSPARPVDGIYACNVNTANADELKVTTGAEFVIGGGRYGIFARNNGTGALTSRPMAMSPVAWPASMRLPTVTCPAFRSPWAARCRTPAARPSDLAIQATGAATTLDNGGVTTGRIMLSDFDDIVTNTDTWNTAGDSDFGDGEDELAERGPDQCRRHGDVADTTQFLNLELLRNGGTISMIDQATATAATSRTA